MKRPAQQLVDTLREQKLTIAFAESMTCGLAAHTIGSVVNTSEVFMGSIVCYDVAVKLSLLKIPAHLIKKYTAESSQVTERLARNLKRVLPASIQAAVTGLAAPGGSESKIKPVGTVFYAMLYRGKVYRAKKLFKGTPLQIKKRAMDGMFTFILRNIG